MIVEKNFHFFFLNSKKQKKTTSKCLYFIKSRRSYDVLLLGLKGSGKTTIGNWAMKIKSPPKEIPSTVGLQMFETIVDNSVMTLIEVGGGDDIRKIWHHYFPKVSLIIIN